MVWTQINRGYMTGANVDYVILDVIDLNDTHVRLNL